MVIQTYILHSFEYILIIDKLFVINNVLLGSLFVSALIITITIAFTAFKVIHLFHVLLVALGDSVGLVYSHDTSQVLRILYV